MAYWRKTRGVTDAEIRFTALSVLAGPLAVGLVAAYFLLVR